MKWHYDADMNIDRILEKLAQEPALDIDLASVSLELAKDEYPELDPLTYLTEIDRLATKLRPRLKGVPSNDANALCELLFVEEGYRGDSERYYDPENSYLNHVMDRRLGLPITLSILAVAIGTRAGLHVDGIGLPGHFIARLVIGREVVLFDPFHGGKVVSVADCEEIVERATGQEFTATLDDLSPSPAGVIMRRLLTNLKGVYLRQGLFTNAARVIRRILQLEPDNCLERRDLGVCLVQCGRPGPAIDQLSSYLHMSPVTADAALVRKLLRQARTEVARWN
jgi:regulator of sirC expression with transglutaminase-like and TPR domain